MEDLETKALAASAEILEGYGDKLRSKARFVLAMAYLEGYGAGVGDAKTVADRALIQLHAELTAR